MKDTLTQFAATTKQTQASNVALMQQQSHNPSRQEFHDLQHSLQHIQNELQLMQTDQAALDGCRQGVQGANARLDAMQQVIQGLHAQQQGQPADPQGQSVALQVHVSTPGCRLCYCRASFACLLSSLQHQLLLAVDQRLLILLNERVCLIYPIPPVSLGSS